MNVSSKVRITCSHGDGTRLVMLWYQQRTGRQSMTLIGFGYGTGDPTYEGQYKEEFKLEREDNVKGALVIPTANLLLCQHTEVWFNTAPSQKVPQCRLLFFSSYVRGSMSSQSREVRQSVSYSKMWKMCSAGITLFFLLLFTCNFSSTITTFRIFLLVFVN